GPFFMILEWVIGCFKVNIADVDSQSLRYTFTVGRICFVAVSDMTVLDLFCSALHFSCSVLEQSFFCFIVLQSEKFTRLFIIVVVIFTEVMFIDGTHGFLRRHFSFRSAVVFVVAVRVVVHMGTKVSVNSHCAVTAEWAYVCSTFRRVYRNLMMVHTKAVALCITIGEQTSLKHFIG